ncbi:MAG: hypothetical protein ACXVED_17020 [Bacteroidia bacterium]
MKVSDINSVIHLLQSISIWGIAFLILIILPVYTIGWSAVFKMLKINNKQSFNFVTIIAISISVSLILLKIGINKDQKLINQASLTKRICISYYVDYIDPRVLKDYRLPYDSTYCDELVNRFPESFTYTWLGGVKGLQLTDKESLKQLDENIDKIIPVVYSELSYLLPKDSALDFNYLRASIDDRISYIVLEKIIAKYPDQFIEMSHFNQILKYDVSFIKRIK